MSWWYDILRQCVFMSFFIIPIPIGSYTIHNGSSAFVALVVYIVLSFCIPWAYLGSREARFSRKQLAIGRGSFVAVWIIISILFGIFSTLMEEVWKYALFWEWPTVSRDIIFILGMYGEICVIMLGAYIVSRVFSMRTSEGR